MSYPQDGNTVKIHYTGRLDDGTVFDSSEGRDPLQFTLGAGQVIVGFEDAVSGLKVGEKTTAHIPAEKAYGPKRDDMVILVKHSQFPPDLTPEVGMKLQIPHPEGYAIPVTVVQIREEGVTLDANHELAGKDLIFDIELVSVE